jgi:hypothetical protein
VPDAVWNTVTGPPGPQLLYDPPFVYAMNTSSPTWDNSSFSPVSLVWDTPTFHGIPFVSVSGTEFTFLAECTVIVSVEPLYETTVIPAEGLMTFTYSGNMYPATPYFGAVYGQYSSAFSTVATNEFLPGLWTTPPFRVPSGGTLGLDEMCYCTTGEIRDVGTSMMITRVA